MATVTLITITPTGYETREFDARLIRHVEPEQLPNRDEPATRWVSRFFYGNTTFLADLDHESLVRILMRCEDYEQPGANDYR